MSTSKIDRCEKPPTNYQFANRSSEKGIYESEALKNSTEKSEKVEFNHSIQNTTHNFSGIRLSPNTNQFVQPKLQDKPPENQ